MQRALVILLLLAGVASAAPTRARWQLGDQRPHAGKPFELILAVTGFEDSPAPAQPKLEIPGATVTPLGVEPRRTGMNIVFNGQQLDGGVTWVFRWKLEIAKPGTLAAPAITVKQGAATATAQRANVEVESIDPTDAMKLELQLPARPVFVGETIEAKLVWLFRSKPQGQEFTLPLGNLDAVTITQPPVPDPDNALEFDIAGKKLALPFDGDVVELAGQRWTRITIHMFVVPRVAGKVEIPPASVDANLIAGNPDVYGRYSLKTFTTSDVTRTLEVKPLPLTDRPPSFAGAVGSTYSMKVETSRSVVQLGEPVELTVTVKSDQRLDTLALGKLQLPADKFTVPDETPTGELAADGKSKTFKVTVQVTAPATELPAIPFAYFDPAKSAYQTIHSDPIALSVKGGSVVGANDVVALAPKPGTEKPNHPPEELALVGAELALSSPDAAMKKPLGGALLAGLVALLYLIPLGLFALRSWQHRTREQREEANEVKTARKKVEAELARAGAHPARETAGPLAAALRALARALDRIVDDDGLLERLETEGYSRTGADAPLSTELRTRAKDLADRWSRDARRTPDKGAAAVALLILALVPASARAGALDTGRDAYQQALGVSEASARKASFTRAAAALGEAAQVTPDRPELLTDWGNAALGAGDVGTAALAYRRALAIDPSNPRAKKNLAWLRNRATPALRPTTGGAADTLFFFHDWPRGRKLVVGAVAFALAILLVVPWSGRRRRGLVMLALIPAIAWLALIVSVALEDHHAGDAVVMDAVVLRAADSSGAPAAFGDPLPRGTEVTVVEQRDTWAKLRIANGTVGWVPSGAVQRVAQ
ncbi:MAG: hypothetical protein ABI678_06470 [Kofleriaceae bacterium]